MSLASSYHIATKGSADHVDAVLVLEEEESISADAPCLFDALFAMYVRMMYNETLLPTAQAPRASPPAVEIAAPSDDYVAGQLDALSLFVFAMMLAFCVRACCRRGTLASRAQTAEPVVVLVRADERGSPIVATKGQA